MFSLFPATESGSLKLHAFIAGYGLFLKEKKKKTKNTQLSKLLTSWRWAIPGIVIQSMEMYATFVWKRDWPYGKRKEHLW